MLIVPDAVSAVDWYKRALGARELWDRGGAAGLEIGGAPFFLQSEQPERAKPTRGWTNQRADRDVRGQIQVSNLSGLCLLGQRSERRSKTTRCLRAPTAKGAVAICSVITCRSVTNRHFTGSYPSRKAEIRRLVGAMFPGVTLSFLGTDPRFVGCHCGRAPLGPGCTIGRGIR